MKFLTDNDAKLFLIEVGNTSKISEATKEYTPSKVEEGIFIKKRRRHETALKDHDQSRKSKEGWRRNRTKMMKGIKSYHKSTEGKRFHKRLGRFLASRLTRNDENGILEYLKGVSTAKTTLITELEFYHPLVEQVELEEMVLEYAIPLLNSIETRIIKGEELTEDEFDFLLDITETSEVVLALANKSNVSVETIEKYWKEIKSALLRDGKKESDEQFYGLLVSILKKKLNLT